MQILPQLIWYALVTSSVYILIAIGLTFVFGILGFINFAHGEMATLGAYLLFSLTVYGHLPYWLGFIIVMVSAAIFGVVLEKLTFKKVRSSHHFRPLVISIGVSTFIQAVIIMIFGGGTSSYRQIGEGADKSYELLDGNLIITHNQIVLMTITILLFIGVGLLLKYTKTGKSLRAVADNKEVAAILGINIDKSVSIIFALGTAIAAIAGMLIAGEQNLNPGMGTTLGIGAFAAVILGGPGKVMGAMLGGLIIGFSENLIVGLTPIPSSFKAAITFFILILALIIRPNGLLGENAESEVRL